MPPSCRLPPCPNSAQGLEGEAPFAFRQTTLVSRGRLWADARRLAESLPDHAGVLNLCEDRYLFSITLLAALQRGQICLLPPSGQPGALGEIFQEFPDAYLASELEPSNPVGPWFPVAVPVSGTSAAPLDFDLERPDLIAFTSGSGGRSKACRHSIHTFEISSRMALETLGLENTRRMVVSTTPPQHMYGLETSIFWPLFSPLAQYPGRPFFPEDIRRILASAPMPCILATTPTHLSALVRTGGEWPNLDLIVSSTARLPEALARQAEAVIGAPVRELYGSTETLSFATRETAREPLWRPYRGARLCPTEEDGARLEAAHLPIVERLEDLFRIEPDGRFEVFGRAGDRIKIAGKRGSLAELNRRLLEVPGVEDGFVYIYEDARGETRTAALVVGSSSKRDILAALRPFLDEVFLPRRIHFVQAIPRNAVGKVMKEQLESLLLALKPLDRQAFLDHHSKQKPNFIQGEIR